MAKLNKVENAVEKCPNCDSKIYCRMTKGSDKYPAKLQWQDEDGSAHYSFDFATKTTSCKNDKNNQRLVTITQNPISMPKSDGVDKQVLERMRKESREVTKQYIAKWMGVKDECEECGITNPAVVGMFFNAQIRSES